MAEVENCGDILFPHKLHVSRGECVQTVPHVEYLCVLPLYKLLLQARSLHASGLVEIYASTQQGRRSNGSKDPADKLGIFNQKDILQLSTVRLLGSPSTTLKPPPTGLGKKRDMRECAEPGCTTQPCFNMEGNVRGLFCAKHRALGMVNVLYRTCQKPACRKIPSYNFPVSNKDLYCADHSLKKEW